MKLFVSGQEFKTKSQPPMVGKIKKFLDASRDGELFKFNQVADAIGAHPTNTLTTIIRFLPSYRCRVKYNQTFFAKPATIKQLKKQLKKENVDVYER